MRISKFLTPPGGWKFQEGGNWIYGDSFDDLVSTLKSNRISNKVKSGTEEKDVEDQLYNLYPSIRVDVIKIKSNDS